MDKDVGQHLKNISIGSSVGVTTRENRNTLIKGIVTKHLTRSEFHTHGIMVELEDGKVGRVKEVYSDIPVEKHKEMMNESQVTIIPKESEITDPLDINRVPKQTTITINEDDTGFSYENLFFPYIKDAKVINIEDAYIRIHHQIMNLGFFCSILPTNRKNITLNLTTGADYDSYKKEEQLDKLESLKQDLLNRNITLNYKIDNNLHDRSITTDNGWKIIPGRGFDIFKAPTSKYSPENFDQTLKKCKKTEINYIKE